MENERKVYFNIKTGEKDKPEVEFEQMGKIMMELYYDKALKAAKNFKSLCTGKAPASKMGKERSFKGSYFPQNYKRFYGARRRLYF